MAAPAAPARPKEEIPAGVDTKQWKAAVKEGGKKVRASRERKEREDGKMVCALRGKRRAATKLS